MAAKVVKLENPLVCARCGSEKIQIKSWINPNTKEIVDENIVVDDRWCEDCLEHCDFTRKDEFDHQKDSA